MPPPSKRIRASGSEKSVTDDLESFQKEIRRIKGLTTDENELAASGIKIEHDYEMRVEDPMTADPKENEDIKKYIRQQIYSSERRIQTQLNRIERKLNRLLEE